MKERLPGGVAGVSDAWTPESQGCGWILHPVLVIILFLMT